jgi:Domain of unknown function (DUF4337)
VPKLSETTAEEFDQDEHAIDAAAEKNPFITRVSITIALLAVAGVTLGSLESIETAATFSANSAALLHQDKATDYWNSYEAKNIKAMLQSLAPQNVAGSSERHATTDRHADDPADKLAAAASGQEHLSEAKLREAEMHAERHHVLTVGVTLVQVGIAIATISIIARGQRWPWYAAIALGVAGALTSAYAYI